MKLRQYTFNFTEEEYQKIINGHELNEKEKECFKYLVKGLNIKEIATELNCSTATVCNRRKSIYHKINYRASNELANLKTCNYT